MWKIIVFQNEDVLDNKSLSDLYEYIQQGIDNGSIVIDSRIKYEVVEFDDDAKLR